MKKIGGTVQTWHVFLVLGVFSLLALFYQGLWGDPRHIPSVLVGQPAQSFSAVDLHSGEMVSLDQYRGKVVVLNFWASWCQECRLEHENLLAINRRFGDHPEFVMLGVDYQDTVKAALAYLRRYGSNSRHVRDTGGVISIGYGVYGVPETFVLDQQGVIRFKHVGPIMGAVYSHLTEEIIVPLLKGELPPTS